MKYIPYVLIVISILITCMLIFLKNLLIPSGYELSIDGYIISRTLCILFILNTLVKLGFYFKKNN